MNCLGSLGGEPAAWFALQVKTRHEKVTADCLVSKGYEAFAPLGIIRSKRNCGEVSGLKCSSFPGLCIRQIRSSLSLTHFDDSQDSAHRQLWA